MIIWWMKNVKDIYSSAKNETTYNGGFCAVFLFMTDSRSFSDRRFVLKGVIHNQSLVFFTVVIFLSYKEFNRIKSKHSCQIFWKFKNWCHQFTIVQKMMTSRIILRNSLDDFDGVIPRTYCIFDRSIQEYYF